MFQDTISTAPHETPSYIVAYMEEKYGVNREDVNERLQIVEQQKEMTRQYMASNKKRHTA
ncbi:MAG: hypothetical protein H7257_00170 [Taibaiella sp.]|nr:hypothetical protein [Taibaiella sp.]